MNTVVFEAREVPSYALHVDPATLVVGNVYFRVSYFEDALLIPELVPLVFIGRDLLLGDMDRWYFQDYDSFRDGIRWGDQSVTTDNPAHFRRIRWRRIGGRSASMSGLSINSCDVPCAAEARPSANSASSLSNSVGCTRNTPHKRSVAGEATDAHHDRSIPEEQRCMSSHGADAHVRIAH